MIVENKRRPTDSYNYETFLSANLKIEVCSQGRSKYYINSVITLYKLPNLKIQEFNINSLFINEELGFSDKGNLPKFIVVRFQSHELYDVRLIDITNGLLISHFKKGDLLPAPLENARILAKNYNYAFVEVYEDKILLVRS